ncbi:MAG: GtrA family protein [Treponemataceae bacterium]|nr:GtrA family protein [Treponemataceae bacterium]
MKYTLFGFIAGSLNTLFYIFFTRVTHFEVVPSTIIAWFLANIFSYYMNKIIVFKTEKRTFKQEVKALFVFLFSRLVSGIGDSLSMFIFVKKLGLEDILVKIISCTVFGIVNYLLGKFVIFSKKKNPENKELEEKEVPETPPVQIEEAQGENLSE